MTTEIERTVSELVRQIERRYHGKYRGVVVDNADPENLGRLRVQVPSVLGDEVVTGWATPCVPYGGNADTGWFMLPEQGAAVWIEFEEGDLEFPVWVGTYWSKPGGKSELPSAIGADGSADTGPTATTRRILKTSGGHTIQIEDAAGQEMILIREAVHDHTIVLDANGIKLTHGKGSYIQLGDDTLTIHAAGGLTLEAPGKKIEIIGDAIEFQKG